MKIAELEGAMLDAWVAKALCHNNISIKSDVCCSFDPISESWGERRYSSDWADGGPAMHRLRKAITAYVENQGIPFAGFFLRADLRDFMRAAVARLYGEDLPDGVPA